MEASCINVKSNQKVHTTRSRVAVYVARGAVFVWAIGAAILLLGGDPVPLAH